MRLLLSPVLAIAITAAHAQTKNERFIEVQVSDSVHLPFAGMDLEVRMQNPYDQSSTLSPDAPYQDSFTEKDVKTREAQAAAYEQEFLALLKTNGFNYRLSETEHAEDYLANTGRKFEVNTYLVLLNSGAELERYYKATEGRTGWSGSAKASHFADVTTQAPRLMRKLYEAARKEAEALVAVTGGHLGRMISAQEVQVPEGSVLEQLFRMDKMKDPNEQMLMMGSTHTSNMAFRFELLD